MEIESRVSCDLVTESKRQIKFLQNLHKNGVTLAEPSYESFRRYRALWLPLVFEEHKRFHDTDQEDTMRLIPPPDIAWMWHCHRLAPYRYAAYVKKRFFAKEISMDTPSKKGKLYVLDAPLPFSFQLKDNNNNGTLDLEGGGPDAASCEYTIKRFESMFPNEPFFLNTQSQNLGTKALPQNTNNNITMEGFDLMGSCERQSAFLWQVSGERFRDDAFLLEGVSNYLKFVQLMGQDPRPQYLVPTYQIDLMWHTHILSSIQGYHQDNIRINDGKTLEHDDSLTDRSEGSTLNTNFMATRKLWRTVYGLEYKVPGGMYRGEPPKAFFEPSWPEKMRLDATLAEWTPDALDGLPFAHLIGKVGASSTPQSWISLDEPNRFIDASDKSTVKGVNSNPKKDGYIFGKDGEFTILNQFNGDA